MWKLRRRQRGQGRPKQKLPPLRQAVGQSSGKTKKGNEPNGTNCRLILNFSACDHLCHAIFHHHSSNNSCASIHETLLSLQKINQPMRIQQTVEI